MTISIMIITIIDPIIIRAISQGCIPIFDVSHEGSLINKTTRVDSVTLSFKIKHFGVLKKDILKDPILRHPVSLCINTIWLASSVVFAKLIEKLLLVTLIHPFDTNVDELKNIVEFEIVKFLSIKILAEVICILLLASTVMKDVLILNVIYIVNAMIRLFV